MTYSIVARDPATGDLGVAVPSRWLAVGAGVAWVEPGVGAVATQSFSEDAYGFHGLRLLREGRTAADALGQLIAQDIDPAVRQVGIVDAAGGSAAHTGIRCVGFASRSGVRRRAPIDGAPSPLPRGRASSRQGDAPRARDRRDMKRRPTALR